MAHVMIPVLVLALLRATGTAAGHGVHAVPAPGQRRLTPRPAARPGINGTPSWTAAAAAGLALAVVTAAAPSLLVPSMIVIALCGVLLGRRGRTVWWALLPSLALFLPFAFSVLDRPRALLADPGLPLGFDAAPLWQQALGQPLNFDAGAGLTGLSAFGGSATGSPAPRSAVGPGAGPAARAAGAAAGPRRAVHAAQACPRGTHLDGTLPVGSGSPDAGRRLARRACRLRRQRRRPGHAVSRARRLGGRLRACWGQPSSRRKDCWTPPTGRPVPDWPGGSCSAVPPRPP